MTATTAIATDANTATAAEQKKKIFLASDVGMRGADPYAFHLEGFVATTPYFKEGTQDSNAYLGVSMGVRGSAEAIFDRATGNWSRDKSYPEKDGFVRLKFFGSAAEEMSKIMTIGRHLVVAGKLEKEEPYEDKDGNTREPIAVLTDGLADLGSRKNNIPATIGKNVVGATQTYTTKDGIIHNVTTACLVQGTIISVAPLASSARGTAYLRFGVRTRLPAEKVFDLANGVNVAGKEYDKSKRIINVVVFNDMATRLSKIITQNTQVVITGEIAENEYNGNISYQMISRDLTIMQYAPKEASAAENTAAPATATSGMTAENTQTATDSAKDCFIDPDEDDGELPF